MIESVDQAFAIINVWKQELRSTVAPLSKNLAFKPTFEADYYQEAIVYRFIELFESAQFLYKKQLFVGAALSARGAIETLAILWFLNDKLRVVTKTEDFRSFSAQLKRLRLGFTGDPELPERINILNAIDAVDKALDGNLRRFYNILSEYAHPNFSGALGAYASVNHETMEVSLSFAKAKTKPLKENVERAMILSAGLFENIKEAYDQLINDVLRLSKRLHEQGKLRGMLDED